MLEGLLLPDAERPESIASLGRAVNGLDESECWGWSIVRRRKTPTRSQRQNAYLWGVCYATILETGLLEGWTDKDLHEYFLGEHFGWETVHGFGRSRIKPLRRSSKLKVGEFSEYVEFIHRAMAERGLVIPDPPSDLL